MSDPSHDLVIAGGILRDERARRKISIGQMAAKVEISKTFVSMVERGWSIPSVENAEKWFRVLGLAVDQRKDIVAVWGQSAFDHAEKWSRVAEGQPVTARQGEATE